MMRHTLRSRQDGGCARWALIVRLVVNGEPGRALEIAPPALAELVGVVPITSFGFHLSGIAWALLLRECRNEVLDRFAGREAAPAHEDRVELYAVNAVMCPAAKSGPAGVTGQNVRRLA